MLVASAGLLAVAALRGDPGLNVPPWVALVVSAGMLAGAAALIAKIARRHRVVLAFIVLLLGTFATTGAWIGFGPGERQCTRGWSDALGRPASGTHCRLVFGAGAVVSTAIMVIALRQLISTRRDESR